MKNPQTLAGWHPMRGREGGKEEEEKERVLSLFMNLLVLINN